MKLENLRQLLRALQEGEADVDDVTQRLWAWLEPAATAATQDAHVDLDRPQRCGFPEVIFCQNKSVQSVLEIVDVLVKSGQKCLGTRVSAEQAEAVLNKYPQTHYNPVARTFCAPCPPDSPTDARVVVLTAGTSDRPVAEEAVETLRWMKCQVELIQDVGVAGPHRLRQQLPKLQKADVAVVVAGMEGALPSVVGGYVDYPVVAVPTSVGYGASLGGLAALLGMLNSCAANVTVVNIDAGFKAGYIAGMIALRTAARRK